jgi:ATP-dependent Clp protease ATP-binding subunit ClpX
MEVEMEKYYDFLSKCIELKDFIENLRFRNLRDRKKLEKKGVYRNFNKIVSEIKNIVEQLKESEYTFEIVKILEELNEVERIIACFKIGENFAKDSAYFSTPLIERILWILSYGDIQKYSEIKIKYLNPYNSKIYKYGFLKKDVAEDLIYEREERIEKLIYKFEVKKEKTQPKEEKEKTYQGLWEYVSERVIGHENIKKLVLPAVWEHYLSTKEPIEYTKTHILLIGPTGVGKTYLIKTISEYLEIPFVYCDITKFTKTGYVGRSVSDMIFDLYFKAGKNRERTEKGIIFIDEIDKIAGWHKEGRDIGGRCVQEELLNLIDCKNKQKLVSYESIFTPSMEINTGKILFVAAGAFEGLKKNEEQKSIGFLGNEVMEEIDKGNNWREILEKYGFMPELIGRFGLILELSQLTKENYIKILKNSADSPIKEFEERFRRYNIKLEIKEDAIEEIAEIAVKMKTGARALKNVIEIILRPYFNDIFFNNFSEKEIIFDRESIRKKIKREEKVEKVGVN